MRHRLQRVCGLLLQQQHHPQQQQLWAIAQQEEALQRLSSAMARGLATSTLQHQPQPSFTAAAASMLTSSASSWHSTPGTRPFSSSSGAAHGGGGKAADAGSISVTFVEKDGKERTVQAHVGDSLLQVAHENEIDLEGACEGSLACSTCHVVVENEEYFKRLPEPHEDELDMLDLAFGLTETSRLGCQIIASKELDGIKVRIPAASRNFYVDGHKPKPH